MSEHTPGPWRVGWEDREPYISPNICRHVSRLNPQCEANARLIAAAPELLERLKFAAYFLERFQSVDRPTEYSGEALRRIQETIAKAEDH